MAENDGFIERSSSEQAEVNDETARTPGPGQAESASNAQALTGHNLDPDVVKDTEGNVIAVHTTKVITDPEAPNAVQVPDPDVFPAANATKANARGVNAEPSPNDVAAGDGEADAVVGASNDESARSGVSGSDDDSDDDEE